MRIIPQQPYETNSRAEYRVFNKLKELPLSNNKYIAFHSLNLTKHAYKRFGEADFVIICEYGLFVLEVKGGGISCENGIWHSTNKQGKHKISNPFKQAESAMHAINKAIKDEFPQFANIPLGYGVIFPDCEFKIHSSEWDKSIICDNGKFKNFESFFEKIFNYWQNKKANNRILEGSEIKEIASYLRPGFEIVESLYNQLNAIEPMMIRLTEEQYQYLDVVASNDRVLCYGGAGTGKTFLAAELSRRIARDSQKVLIVCKSNWLKQYLNSKITNEFVIVSTIDSAKLDMKRAGFSQCNTLIVDEGQDLFNLDDIEILDELIIGGLEKGRWYIFHDSNNQSGLFVQVDEEVLELLESYHPAKVPLTINCRNTNPILKYIENQLEVDMGRKDDENGPKVTEKFENKDGAGLLEEELNKLLSEDIPRPNITILSPFIYEDAGVSLLPKKLQNRISNLDSYSINSFPDKDISFAQIKNFKGLENEVIIIIDLPKEVKKEDRALYYVAMSRARSLLSIIWKG